MGDDALEKQEGVMGRKGINDGSAELEDGTMIQLYVIETSAL
jgi:hypothetical protein